MVTLEPRPISMELMNEALAMDEFIHGENVTREER